MELLNSTVGLFAGKNTRKTDKYTPRTARRTIKNGKHITHKMVCSPHIEMKQTLALRNTCYTPAILDHIKREYNKSHPPEKHIVSVDPSEIWMELDKRLSHCKTEDCWLAQIRDKHLRKKIDRYVFAPDKPYEWKRNPTEWLSNYDILNVLEQYEIVYPEFEFIGPTPIDFDTRLGKTPNPYDIGNETVYETSHGKKCVWNDLCHFSLSSKIRHKKYKIGVIFNLDKHNQSGSHWVSLFVDVRRKYIFYFDSAGGEMPPEIRALMDRIHEQASGLRIKLKEYANGEWQHQRGNTECGMYSLFFIITMLTGKFTPSSRKYPLRKIMNMFLKDKIPDGIMEQYRDEYFNDA
jgi:hypothetical protein